MLGFRSNQWRTRISHAHRIQKKREKKDERNQGMAHRRRRRHSQCKASSSRALRIHIETIPHSFSHRTISLLNLRRLMAVLRPICGAFRVYMYTLLYRLRLRYRYASRKCFFSLPFCQRLFSHNKHRCAASCRLLSECHKCVYGLNGVEANNTAADEA